MTRSLPEADIINDELDMRDYFEVTEYRLRHDYTCVPKV